MGINNTTDIDTIAIGIAPYTQKYILQKNQLLIYSNVENIFDENFLITNNLESLEDYITLPHSESYVSISNPIWVKLIKDTDNAIDLDDFVNNLIKNNTNINLITPVYYIQNQNESSASSPLINNLIIKFNKNPEYMINQIKNKYNLEYEEIISQYLKPYYSFKIIDSQFSNKGFITYFKIKNQIANEDGVESVDFDWLKVAGGYLSSMPNDTYFPQQWNLQKINFPPIWKSLHGSAEIYVAVIDSGFDLTLGGSEFGGSDLFKEITFSPNSSPDFTHFNAEEADLGRLVPYRANQSTYPHGTAVAGIIGAIINNNKGIAGLASDCKIMPIKIGSKVYSRRVAMAINWARLHGAKVINMSFRCDPIDSVITAIENAWNSGIFLCAAAGNIDGDQLIRNPPPPIEFPARHHNVISVGASDTQDQRKRNRSTMEESECWASCFGTELNVIAPGILIWTTDERGGFGFNKNNGGPQVYSKWCVNYSTCGDSNGSFFSRFSGTSASAPHIAGLAALLFSQNTSLNNQDVQNIIERTCDKVNPSIYNYTIHPDRPNGTWNEEVGYGRINFTAALTDSQLNPTITTNPKFIKCLSIGETKTRIVVVFEKRTGNPDIDGIYKVDIDKEFPLVDPESYTLQDNAARVVPISFYAGADPSNPDSIMHLELVTEVERELVGILWVATNEAATTRDDSLYAGQIIGDLFVHYPITPIHNLGTVHKVYGKFRKDGKTYFFYNRTKNGVTSSVEWPFPNS